MTDRGLDRSLERLGFAVKDNVPNATGCAERSVIARRKKTLDLVKRSRAVKRQFKVVGFHNRSFRSRASTAPNCSGSILCMLLRMSRGHTSDEETAVSTANRTV